MDVRAHFQERLRLQRLLENYLLYAQLELKPSEILGTVGSSKTHDVENIVQTTAEVKAGEYGRLGDMHFELCTGSAAIASGYCTKIVEELVDNVLKFSKVGSPVFISTQEHDGGFSVGITDRGRGMTTQQIKQIGAFVQFDRSVYEQQGMGLGLILAKKLVHLYGGKLTVQSEVSTGTTVKVLLP